MPSWKAGARLSRTGNSLVHEGLLRAGTNFVITPNPEALPNLKIINLVSLSSTSVGST